MGDVYPKRHCELKTRSIVDSIFNKATVTKPVLRFTSGAIDYDSSNYIMSCVQIFMSTVLVVATSTLKMGTQKSLKFS